MRIPSQCDDAVFEATRHWTRGRRETERERSQTHTLPTREGFCGDDHFQCVVLRWWRAAQCRPGAGPLGSLSQHLSTPGLPHSLPLACWAPLIPTGTSMCTPGPSRCIPLYVLSPFLCLWFPPCVRNLFCVWISGFVGPMLSVLPAAAKPSPWSWDCVFSVCDPVCHSFWRIHVVSVSPRGSSPSTLRRHIPLLGAHTHVGCTPVVTACNCVGDTMTHLLANYCL